jgi:hypothetical protein
VSESLAGLIRENEPCVALTGAGVSTETTVLYPTSRRAARPAFKAAIPGVDIAGVTPVSRRIVGIAWALVVCPIVAWFAALSADNATQGRLGVWVAPILLLVLPAALAAGVNLALGRGGRPALAAALLAALVSAAGFVAFLIYFFLTVPDDFFT